MGAMSEEAKTEPGDQSADEKLSDADIKSEEEKFEYDDSDSDDEGIRAAAALLCQSLGQNGISDVFLMFDMTWFNHVQSPQTPATYARPHLSIKDDKGL